jgi:5-methyltetrahydrofolate--homocysteine methyltransferase
LPPGFQVLLVGKIGEDQLDDMARRCGADKADVERWLAPNLA